MYRKTLLAIVCIPIASAAFSQTWPAVTVPDVTDITKVTLHPGFSYEKRIGRHQTLYGQIFPAVNISLDISDGFGGYSSDASFYIDPAVFLQYRFYYNGRIRQVKGKRTELNSMNYIGVVDRIIFSKRPIDNSYDSEKHLRPMNTLGAVWGLQRNFNRSRVSIDFNIGPAVSWAKTTSTSLGNTQTEYIGVLSLLTQFDVGFWLNKRK